MTTYTPGNVWFRIAENYLTWNSKFPEIFAQFFLTAKCDLQTTISMQKNEAIAIFKKLSTFHKFSGVYITTAQK